MTARARDAFERFQGGLAAGTATAVNDLAKETLDTAKLPSWMPARFDWSKANGGALEILTGQGEPAGSIGPG